MTDNFTSSFKCLHLLGSVGKGGAEVLFYDLALLVNKKEDHKFHFAFFKGGFLEAQLSELTNVTKLNPNGKLNLIFALRRLIKKKRISIVHCHSPIHLVYVSLATLGIKCKLILTVHGFKKTIKTELIYNLSFYLANKVFFVSEAFKTRFLKSANMKDNKGKYSVLYNGISTKKLFQKKENEKIQRAPLHMGMIGNFYNDVRDQLTICRAASLLKKKNIQFKFSFVGGANEKNTFFLDQCRTFVEKEGLQDCVEFLGFQDNVFKFLTSWDVFVYSSNRDTFGIAVVEAMLFGIPVIVNDLDVFKEISCEGKYASLYKSKSEDDLALTIKHFIANRELYNEKAKQASKFVKETFMIENHYNALQKKYNQL